MNLWVGREVHHDTIVDDWNNEMNCWQRHYFQYARFSRFGIGCSDGSTDDVRIIVVAYH
jgi:hypothetical protein